MEPFPASTGDIYLLRSDGGNDVVLREATPLARELVESLATGAPVADEPQLNAAIAELEEAGVVADTSVDGAPTGLSPTELLRYDRQLHYFGDQASSGSSAVSMQLALRDATVVVLGAGGLGSWTMSGLACAGVGRIVAVDDDTIELSNLNRQVLYASDVGPAQGDVAAESLSVTQSRSRCPGPRGWAASRRAIREPMQISWSAPPTGRCTRSGVG